MSLADVYQVFGPAWELEIERLRKQQQLAERCILNLRLKLREYDPTLPDEHDGPAWWERIEGTET